MLTSERWQKVRDVLEQALELAPEKRSRFLDLACGSDPTLRSEVQSLLSADEQARSSFLKSPPLSPSALTTGLKLGEYEIVSQIGSGGMGVVYRATDLRLGRDVAIKVLSAHLSSDPNRLLRFEQEAKSAAALNHPNILAVYQLGSYEGAPYLVSELLEGETLREQLRHGAEPPDVPEPVHRTTEQYRVPWLGPDDAATFAPDGKSFLFAVPLRGEVTIFRQPWSNGKVIGTPQVALKVPFAFPLAYQGGNAYAFSRDLSTIVYAHPGGHADSIF